MTKDEFYFWSTMATLVVALCALALTIWQGISARQHNIISVKPKLKFSAITGTVSWELTLHNLGLGPAYIQEMKWHIDGKSVGPIEFNDYFQNRFSDKAGEVRLDLSDYAIPANQRVTMVAVGFSHNTDIAQELTNLISMSVKYTSAYNEVFIEKYNF